MNTPKKQKYPETFIAWLGAEVAQRMIEKLALVRITPTQILVVDAHSPKSLQLLKKLYKNALLFTVFGLKLRLFQGLGSFLGFGIPKYRVIKSKNKLLIIYLKSKSISALVDIRVLHLSWIIFCVHVQFF